MLPSVSVIVATKNRIDILRKSLQMMLNQNYSGNYEVIVVNDGSTDDTQLVLKNFKKQYPKKLRIYRIKHSGPNIAKNFGIRKSRKDIAVIMDDDCIPNRNWLKNLISPIKGRIACTSSFTHVGGTSTAFKRSVLEKIGSFDLAFNEFNFRDDTDLAFRVLEAGYELRQVKTNFKHLHAVPKTIKEKILYGIRRILIHQVDVLLYKKHPKLTKELLNIKFGFWRPPVNDLKNAVGLWHPNPKRHEYMLISPQGVILLGSSTPFHSLIIFILGIFYSIALKLIRLYGSIRYGKLLL